VAELAELGYSQVEMAGRLGIRHDSLARMLQRENIELEPLLAQMAHERKRCSA
jgi:hypothetical protein